MAPHGLVSEGSAAVWGDIVLKALAGLALSGLIRGHAGKQLAYLGKAFWRVPHMLRNDWLCPHCLGAHNVDGGMCLVCHHCNQLCARQFDYSPEEYKSRLGYVRWSYLWRNWDLLRWRQRPIPRPVKMSVPDWANSTGFDA
jgi:hypothetical protein